MATSVGGEARRPDPIQHLTPLHELSLFAGASGVGKTTILLQAVAALQRGQPFFGMVTDPACKIGYFAADRTWDSYAQVAALMGVDLSRIEVLSLIDTTSNLSLGMLASEPSAILFKGLNQLRERDCDFIIVDPLVLFLGCDVRSYHEVAAGLIQISRWCKQRTTTILGTHHAAKARTDYGYKRPQDRISGSAALLGFTSTQIFLDAPNENDLTYYRLTVVAHTAPAQEFQLQRDPATEGAPFQLYAAGADPIDSQILSAIPLDAETAISAIYQQLSHIPPHQLEQHLTALALLGLIERRRNHVQRLRPSSGAGTARERRARPTTTTH